MNDRVVVTGRGIVCSLGENAEEVWKALLSNRTGIKPIEGFDSSGFPCRYAAETRDLDPRDLAIHPRDSRIMDRHSYLLMRSTRDAYREAGLDKTTIPRDEIGFFAGMGMVDYEIRDLLPAVLKSLTAGSLDYGAFYSEGYREIYPLWPLSMLNNIALCQVATSLDLQGENAVFSPHADSGMMAVAEGMKALLDRRAQVALCAGVSEKVGLLSLARAHLTGLVKGGEAQDLGLCKPFDRERRGAILGEGSAVITMELESSARKRQARSYGVVRGYGLSCERDRRSQGPTTRALARAIEEALERSFLRPDEIDLIIAHGEGTASADRKEIEAIHEVFSGCLDKILVFASKGALGHLLAGAPVVDVVLGLVMLGEGVVPPTIGTTTPDPSIRFRLVSGSPIQKTLKRIVINGQSYEGQAMSLVIEAQEG